MIHSSSSRGVIETEVLTDSYWLPRMRFGRRVLSLPTESRTVAPDRLRPVERVL